MFWSKKPPSKLGISDLFENNLRIGEIWGNLFVMWRLLEHWTPFLNMAMTEFWRNLLKNIAFSAEVDFVGNSSFFDIFTIVIFCS